uniref:hypothetical protein n=1 Tax=Lentilactobacillus hilgardii TaxID=1588 RepID=UPI00403F5F0D
MLTFFSWILIISFLVIFIILIIKIFNHKFANKTLFGFLTAFTVSLIAVFLLTNLKLPLKLNYKNVHTNASGEITIKGKTSPNATIDFSNKSLLDPKDYYAHANDKGYFFKHFIFEGNRKENVYNVSSSIKNEYFSKTKKLTIFDNSYSKDNNKRISKAKNINLSKLYEKKLSSLGEGTAEYAKYNKNTNTVTWVGYQYWKKWKKHSLQPIIEILQTITERQEVNYGIKDVHIIVKLPDGTVVAKNSSINMDLKIIK